MNFAILNKFETYFRSRSKSTASISTMESASLRIVIVSDRVYPYFKGGAEKRYWEIAKKLTDLGYEVSFLTGQWPGMPKQCVVDGITLIGVYKVGNFYVKGRKSIIETLKYTVKVLKFLFSEEYDLIDCEQFPLLPIFVSKLASIIRRKPLIVSWLEVWGKDQWLRYLGQMGRIGALIESISVHLPDHIISISEYTTMKLTNMYGVDDIKISTVPLGIDTQWERRVSDKGNTRSRASTHSSRIFSDSYRDSRIPVDRSDMIFVGRLLKHKNVDMLLEAVDVIKESRLNVTCMVIGDGPERKSLEEKAKNKGIDNHVNFLGFIENYRRVYDYIQHSSVFILPSTREGFGIVVLEANCCGVPVLVINHAENAACKLVKEGKNGFICDFEPHQIAQKVLKIIDGPPNKYLDTCIAAAKKFNWELVGNRTDEIYQSLKENGSDRNPSERGY